MGIDFIAGPSEVLIIADETANPVFIALDLLAQAEHDTNAKPNLITTSGKLAEEVNKQLETQLNRLRTGDVAKFALENGRIILADSLDVAVEIGNKIAPEHLELQVKNPKQLMKKLRNYGSLFIGKYSAEVFGDYCSGTNHILPTNRAARYSGGLSVKDFIKILTYQQIDQRGADKLAGIGSKLAEIEGLEAHRKSAEIRST